MKRTVEIVDAGTTLPVSEDETVLGGDKHQSETYLLIRPWHGREHLRQHPRGR